MNALRDERDAGYQGGIFWLQEHLDVLCCEPDPVQDADGAIKVRVRVGLPQDAQRLITDTLAGHTGGYRDGFAAAIQDFVNYTKKGGR